MRSVRRVLADAGVVLGCIVGVGLLLTPTGCNVPGVTSEFMDDIVETPPAPGKEPAATPLPDPDPAAPPDAPPPPAAPRCGDGIKQVGEGCDDGNAVDDDACTNACKLPTCGDGIVQAGEECDDGNAVDDDACTNACTTPTCGDGIVQAGEECDDATEACSSECKVDRCPGGAYAEGRCWYVSTDCATAEVACAAKGLVGVTGFRPVPWTQETLESLAAQLGYEAGGHKDCCAPFSFVEDGKVYTHSYGAEYYNWPSGCWGGFQALMVCDAPEE